MPLVDLDDPVELRARWAALAAVAHAAGRDRIWWADGRGLHYEDTRGNDLRLIPLSDGRAVLFGYHYEESRTADEGAYADLLSGAPDWIGQPEVRHRMATGQLGFVYGHFSGTWARAEYPGDPWQPVEDGFLAIASWLTDDREAEYELAEQLLTWAGPDLNPDELRFGAMGLIRAAGTRGIRAPDLDDFFALLRGSRGRVRPGGGGPDVAAGLAAAAAFGRRPLGTVPVRDPEPAMAPQPEPAPPMPAVEPPMPAAEPAMPAVEPRMAEPAAADDGPDALDDESAAGFWDLFDWDESEDEPAADTAEPEPYEPPQPEPVWRPEHDPVAPVSGVPQDPSMLWALPAPDEDEPARHAAPEPVAELVAVPDVAPEPEPGRRPEAAYDSLEEAMRAEPERPRPRPEPGPAFKTLHEWCRERTLILPSGFTIHVYVANPQTVGYSYDLEPPVVPGARLASDQIGSLLHALWQEETDTEHGAWMFARLDAAGRTLRVDRWYDSIPSWWQGPIADRPVDSEDVAWHLEHRSGRWQPSYAGRLELVT